jgi:hypothetical protein
MVTGNASKAHHAGSSPALGSGLVGCARLTETARGLPAEWDRQGPAEPVITATRAPIEPGTAPDADRMARPDTTFTIAW